MSQSDCRINLTLFASFDLANSSSFKYFDREWPTIFMRAFTYLKECLVQHSQWHFWKTNGDEILFFHEDARCVLTGAAVLETDSVMKQCIQMLHTQFRDHENIKQLSLKTTLWIAGVCPLSTDEFDTSHARDFQIHGETSPEFFGMETDIGFRISKFTPRSKTGISASLLYWLLSSESDVLDCIRIVDFVRLKGILHGKRYPIIWYLRSLKKATEIERSFHYDERYENESIHIFLQNIKTDPHFGVVNQSDFNEMLDYLGLKSFYDRVLV